MEVPWYVISNAMKMLFLGEPQLVVLAFFNAEDNVALLLWRLKSWFDRVPIELGWSSRSCKSMSKQKISSKLDLSDMRDVNFAP